MTVSAKTKIMLWGRSASRCAFSDGNEVCRQELVWDATETDDEALIGEAAHIVGQEVDGPRGDSPLTDEQRDKYNNLILLCVKHHTIIDKQPSYYTVERLKEMKATHEKWVRESLKGFDKDKQHDHEIYASYIEELLKQAELNGFWITEFFVRDSVMLEKSRCMELERLCLWITARVWPRRYVKLEEAFLNFNEILASLLAVFRIECEPQGNYYVTIKKYNYAHNSQHYYLLLELFNYTGDLLWQLAIELIKAANYICDCYRTLIDPTYRLAEGVFLVDTQRYEYKVNDPNFHLYQGLEKFKQENGFAKRKQELDKQFAEYHKSKERDV